MVFPHLARKPCVVCVVNAFTSSVKGHEIPFGVHLQQLFRKRNGPRALSAHRFSGAFPTLQITQGSHELTAYIMYSGACVSHTLMCDA